jgi:glutathione S-transferase
VVETLDKAITPGPYILQQRFSAADVYLGSQIGIAIMFKSLEPRPSFQRYLDLLHQRPAYQRLQEQSEQLLARLKSVG